MASCASSPPTIQTRPVPPELLAVCERAPSAATVKDSGSDKALGKLVLGLKAEAVCLRGRLDGVRDWSARMADPI